MKGSAVSRDAGPVDWSHNLEVENALAEENDLATMIRLIIVLMFVCADNGNKFQYLIS